MHQFLWCRLVAAVAVTALLRHRGANPRSRGRQAGFASSGLIADIDVAIAHDYSSFVELRSQRATAWKSCKSFDWVRRTKAWVHHSRLGGSQTWVRQACRRKASPLDKG
jgi:hypothetical protein